MILITSGGDAVQLFDLRFYDDRFHNGEVLIKATFYDLCEDGVPYGENDVPYLVCKTIAKRYACTEEQVKSALDDFKNNILPYALNNPSFSIPADTGWIRTF